MRQPGAVDLAGLLQPIQTVKGGANDIQPLVLIDVSVRQIEARNLCADDADGVFSKSDVWVANIFKPSDALLTATAYNNVSIAVLIQIYRLGVLRDAVASKFL